MNHKAKFDGDGGADILPFTPPSHRPAAAEPIPLGEAVAAVVMNLRYGFPRINCDRQDAWEEETGPGGL